MGEGRRKGEGGGRVRRKGEGEEEKRGEER